MSRSPERSAHHPGFGRQRLVPFFFFAVLLFLLWQVLRILSPFYIALLGSAILALLFHPLHERVLRRMPRWPALCAGLSTVTVVLVVVIPLLTLGWMTVRETTKVYPVVRQWVRETASLRTGQLVQKLPKRVVSLWDKGRIYADRWNIEPQGVLLKSLDEASKGVAGATTKVIKNTLFVVFNILVLTFTLFFFLRDGPQLIQRGLELIPMAPKNKTAVLDRLQTTLYAIFRGVFVVAVLQGVMAAIGYAIIGVPFAVLLGALTTFLGVIPFIGPTTIWIPVAVGMALSGAYLKALFVVLWGLLVVSAIDNFLRPILVSSDAKLPLLAMFFGMLGGLKVYGFPGLLLGPVVIALVLAFIDIYRQEYHWLLAPAEKPRS